MALALTVVIALVLAVLALVGYLRDLRRSLLALLGTLVGAILVNFWGNQWGASLASRLVDADVQRMTFYVNCAVFLWSTLVVGYAGGILLNRARDRSLPQRLTGVVLGLVNGVLIVGFLLRFATSNQPSSVPVIQANPLAKAIHDGLPLLFLAVAGVVTVLVLLRAAFSLLGRGAPPPAQPSAPKPAAPQAAGSTAEKRVGDSEVIKKVGDALKR
jgi:uncharacterized membrane protein required for colicin V production